MRFLSILALALTALILASTTTAAASAPVIKYRDDQFGPILATPKKQALYYWRVEKRAGGKIRCTGSCAKAWPPLYAKGAVPRKMRGIAGTFGTIRRPDGRVFAARHLTVLYTNGWFVVRVHS